MELPWFGVTKDGGKEGKYSIISLPVYETLDIARRECKKVNKILERSQTKDRNCLS